MPVEIHPVLNEDRINCTDALLLLLIVVVVVAAVMALHLCRFFVERRVASIMTDIVYDFFYRYTSEKFL